MLLLFSAAGLCSHEIPWLDTAALRFGNFHIFIPVMSRVLIYSRESIQCREWWRLITGNLVHLSDMYLTLNVFGLLVVGTITELRGDRYLWLVCAITAVVIGLVVYVTLPELQFYGGLSGIVSAVVVYLCMSGLRYQGAWRWLCLLVLMCVASKIGLESLVRDSFFPATATLSFIPAPASLLAGFCSALLIYALIRFKKKFLLILLVLCPLAISSRFNHLKT